MESETTSREPESTVPVVPSEETSRERITHVTTPEESGKSIRTKFCSINPADGPDIAKGESGFTAQKANTVPKMLKFTMMKVPDRTALRYKNGENWTDVTYQQYHDLSVAAAKSFLKVQCTCTMFFYLYITFF